MSNNDFKVEDAKKISYSPLSYLELSHLNLHTHWVQVLRLDVEAPPPLLWTCTLFHLSHA